MNYISSAIIFEKISKFHIPGADWNDEEILEWIYESLEMIDNNNNYIIEQLQLSLEDGKVRLPSEIQEIKSIITEDGTELEASQNGYTLEHDYNYLINNGYLYTNKSDLVLVTYATIPLDKNDYPMIPDDSYFLKAIEAYCRFKIGERSYYAGKLMQPQFTTLKQDWLWRLPGAKTSGKMDIMNSKTRFAKLHQRHKF